jgi:hypothetical protein
MRISIDRAGYRPFNGPSALDAIHEVVGELLDRDRGVCLPQKTKVRRNGNVRLGLKTRNAIIWLPIWGENVDM